MNRLLFARPQGLSRSLYKVAFNRNRQFTSFKPAFRPFFYTLLAFQKPSHLLITQRNYSSRGIRITNPYTIGVLRIVRSVIKGVLLFACAAASVIGVCAAFTGYYLNQQERITFFDKGVSNGNSIPYHLKMFIKLALFVDITGKSPEAANEYYMMYLRAMNRDNSVPFDKDSDVIEEFIPNDKIFEKGKGWYNLYVDILIRVAIIKAQRGNLENSKPFLEKAISFIEFAKDKDYNVAKPYLRNQGYRLLAKIYEFENKNLDKIVHSPQSLENLYVDSIITVYESNTEFMKLNKIDTFDDMIYLNDKNVKILTRDLLTSINELAAHYSKNKSSKTAFKIYVNNLEYFDKNREKLSHSDKLIPDLKTILDWVFGNEDNSKLPFSLQVSDIPLLKLYIGELLWQSKNHLQAINWSKESFIESFNYSKQDKNSSFVAKFSIENLISMYRILNRKGEYDERIKRCEDISKEIYIPAYTSAAKMVWDHVL